MGYTIRVQGSRFGFQTERTAKRTAGAEVGGCEPPAEVLAQRHPRKKGRGGVKVRSNKLDAFFLCHKCDIVLHSVERKSSRCGNAFVSREGDKQTAMKGRQDEGGEK